MSKKSIHERFWSKVDICGPNECWNWKAGMTGEYGCFMTPWKKSPLRANRVSWCLHHGASISDIVGLDVCHTCDNPPCVNPSHLFLGTRLDNVRDMHSKGREKKSGWVKGENHGKAILTEKDVLLIRRRVLNGEKRCELAIEFGVHPSTIRLAVIGKNWKHLVEPESGSNA